MNQRAQRHGVLHDGEQLTQILGNISHGQACHLHAFGNQLGVASQPRAVVNNRSARLDLAGMPLDAVLVESDQDVQVIAVGVDLLFPNPQKAAAAL